MKRIQTLREQAQTLRALAMSLQDSPTVKEDLLALAKRCEALAIAAEREMEERLSQPISRAPSAR